MYGEHEGIGSKGYRVGEYSRIIDMGNDYFRPIMPLYYVMELQQGQVDRRMIISQSFPGSARL
ncbi:hypothetical protein N2K84_01480 [Prolixibacteraceae bacterium A06]|uniref:Uncharacterized protein n=2 Tax=Gaoshiqia sediminis TaxID=2986998 RepID=A0AA42C7A3_9BACT|nr:hypothetical protein [Gaoshiqia sediminis]